MTAPENEYHRTCFVIMPYGNKEVAGSSVNFDLIYEDIFQPAVRMVRVERQSLIPKRADDAKHSRILDHTMLQDVLRSRLALVDLSTPNMNVGIELGARWRHLKSGTVLVRLVGTEVPFNARLVQVMAYEHMPEDAVARARNLIAKVLRETLHHNAVDSPYYAQDQLLADSMGPPENPTKTGILLVDAEQLVRNGKVDDAMQRYREAAAEAQPLAKGLEELLSDWRRDKDENKKRSEEMARIAADNHKKKRDENKKWSEEMARIAADNHK